MATKRLNMQIGGGDPDDYARRKVERELAEHNKQVDDAMDLFFEEMVAPALEGKPTPIMGQPIR